MNAISSSGNKNAMTEAVSTVIKSTRASKAKRNAIPTVESSVNSNDKSNVNGNVEIEDKNKTPSNGDFVLASSLLKRGSSIVSLASGIDKLEVSSNDDFEPPGATSDYDEPPEGNTNDPPGANTNDPLGANTNDLLGAITNDLPGATTNDPPGATTTNKPLQPQT
ncbi:18131_t:CDS:2 [Racocetra persica]|uniref:18131_t:CDS:1 n=1 Tax=Racocetra persica TaxID=160502 RepID=A0ACA9PTX9_9GLOM|nr:18131_t:CDS:2 [Racocetra persica]